MRKNIILLVIDSLNYSRVKETDYRLMPYLRKLEEEGVSCSAMYSEAPYTEAASMNIYCGQDTLDYNGYLFRYKDSPKTLFEVLKEAGYETYYNSYQPQCHPTSVTRGVDALFYNVGFDLDALWSYRLSHYANLLKENKLTEEDDRVLTELFDDNFKAWDTFAEQMIRKDAICSLIAENAANYDAGQIRDSLQTERIQYQENKKGYIHEVLAQGKGHRLFLIPAYIQDRKLKDAFVKKRIKKLFRPLLRKIRWINIWRNLLNNKGIFSGAKKKRNNLCRHPSMAALKEYLKALYVSFNTIFDLDIYQRISQIDTFKNAPSVYKHLEHFFAWEHKRISNKPYFACIHVDDIHNPETFFTYDTDNLALLQKQKDNAEKYVKSIGKDYKGIISHDLSLLYMDSVLEDFVDRLKQTGVYDNSIVIITADHGFSFSGNPVRDSFVINRYLENYNIPFVVCNCEYGHRRINHICRSTDIAATIANLAGATIPANFSGLEIMDAEKAVGRSALIEFCGGGCPDLSRREILAAAFDLDWFVGVNYTLNSEITDGSIREVYDLRSDPLQMVNLATEAYDRNRINELLAILIERKRRIMAGYHN